MALPKATETQTQNLTGVLDGLPLGRKMELMQFLPKFAPLTKNVL